MLRIALVGLVSLVGVAHAGETRKQVREGVTLITRTDTSPNNVIHVLKIDMTTPGVSLGSTASSARQRTTSSFVNAAGAAAAINGDLFSYSTYATTGIAAGGNAKWSDTSDNNYSANIAFGNGERVEIHDASEILKFDGSWMKGIVSGHPQLVKAGTAITTNPASPACPSPNPRTAVGLSEDRKTVFMVVVDGRTSASVGMTCTQLAKLMKELGAYQAINLDGGGSSTMYLKGSGILNKPSDGSERVVANHFAVYAPKLGSLGSIEGLVHDAADPAHVLAGASVSVGDGNETTDDTGHFSLDATPGDKQLTVKLPGYATAQVAVTVAMGAAATVDVPLAIDPTADFDGDGVPDARDTCLEVENPEQTDTNGNGLGDACDADDDGDGLADEDDNCPLAVNPDQTDADADGVGDACVPSAGGCAVTGDTPAWLLGLLVLALRRRRT